MRFVPVRMWAIVERELRRFRRTPVLIIASMALPIVQLVVLGYAFGGKVRHLQVGVVDHAHAVPAVKLREMFLAIASNAQTFEAIPFTDEATAVTALRNGHLNGVLIIPSDFGRRVDARDAPRIALIEDNTDNFVAASITALFQQMVGAYDTAPSTSLRVSPAVQLDVVEVYPYVPYIQYLLPGSIVMSIFMMVMISGGITFIDDKARGVHEGYLVTPITRLELILGFNIAGTIKSVLSGTFLLTIGSVIAGVPDPFDPTRLLRLYVVIAITAISLMSMMFLLMVRMEDPLLPRAIFGVLNTLLYFPSGAIYPQQAFPTWMRWIAVVDPFTYAVHALKALLLRNTGFVAIIPDLLYLGIFATLALTAATLLFKRTL